MKDYVFTLSNKAEMYTVKGAGNLERPKDQRIVFELVTMSAADSTTAARVASTIAGDTKDKNWESKYLAQFQEESFCLQIGKIKNLKIRDTKTDEIRLLVDPRELWNSKDVILSGIATEVQIYLSSRSGVPVKN